MRDLLHSGQDEGTIRPGDVRLQTKFVWRALHGTVPRELTDWLTADEATENHRRLVRAALSALMT